MNLTIHPTIQMATKLLALLFLLFNGAHLQAQLSGTYSICNSGCDYTSLAPAITDINTQGLSADVTFEILGGTYFWPSQGIINYAGPHAIVVSSKSGLPDVQLETTTGGAFIEIAQAADVNFSNLLFYNNSLISNYTGILAGDVDHVEVTTCTFDMSSGGTGVKADGASNPNSELVVSDCEFQKGDIGIFCLEQTNSSFKLNILQGQDDNGIVIEKTIKCELKDNDVSFFFRDGIVLRDCEDFIVKRNHVFTPVNPGGGVSRRGIWIDASIKGSSPGASALVENNMVVVRSVKNVDPQYGITVSKSSLDIDVYHNSVQMYNKPSGGAAFQMLDSDDIDVKNNIFSNIAFDPSIVETNCNQVTCNYNNYFNTAAPNFLGVQNGTSYGDLSTWSAATGYDRDSKGMLPGFTSTTDLHVCNTNLTFGTPTLPTPDDIDGDTRGVAPYVGADEGEYKSIELIFSESGCVLDVVCDPPTNGTTYNWNFGDGSGTTATSTNSTSHTYSGNGTYLITLVVNTPCGCAIRATGGGSLQGRGLTQQLAEIHPEFDKWHTFPV